jgi:hypothetical protein
MPNCDDQYERTCKGEFAEINAKLDKLDIAIRGNGKPGIQLRLDRLEVARATRSRLMWIIAASTITAAIGSLWQLIGG